ncbi:MAG: glycosyltransferase family 4 protein [Flaviaesturariibacter sp.]|nr:glycosyltransferase family 4 protein [Flaviaesturariibacter sp.]
MPKPLHIVCLDSPVPPDYGGAIDMYYKVVELSMHWEITLHYFNYKKERNADPLKIYCKNIYSYKRRSIINGLLSNQPYIVASRINQELIQRLNLDTNPVLLEGIHCSGILPYLKNKDRKVVIRMHNDEAEYYKQLAHSENNYLKKIFFSLEGRRLKKYQSTIPKDLSLACVSYTDMKVLETDYGFTNLHFIPSFTNWQRLESLDGLGTYCLYQGNLSVSENSKIALWLLNEVFSKIEVPFLIAGKGISKTLEAAASKNFNVKLIKNPSGNEMDDLVKNAQINVLPSLNNTGLKLKLLHALFYGRHCLTNKAGITGTAFTDVACIADSPTEFIEEIKRLFTLPFSKEELHKRERLAKVYSNVENASKLNALL